MAKITKTREQDAWRIRMDGQTSPLFIRKGDAPKFGKHQTYDVWCAENYLFECNSVSAAMGAIQLLTSLGSSADEPVAWLRDAQPDAEDEALFVCDQVDPGAFPVWARP